MSTDEQSNVINPNDLRAGCLNLKGDPPSAMTYDDMKKRSTYVEFNKPFQKGSRVIVTPMVQTFNGGDTPGVRITDADHKGFRIRINELVGNATTLSDGWHKEETIGWIAVRIS